MMKKLLSIVALLAAFTWASAQDVKVTFYSPDIVRITKGDCKDASFSVIKTPEQVAVKVTDKAATTTYRSPSLTVTVDKATGNVSFLRAGKLLIGECGSEVKVRESGLDAGALTVKQSWMPEKDEAFYGLGILQDGKLNIRGKHVYMLQANMEDFQPVVQSVKGYGILWDNPSPTTFNDDGTGMSFESEVASCIDYYFIYGGSADGFIAQVRELTGEVPMLPIWAFGFMQSRERYTSTGELLEVLRTYRKLGVPVDVMIQDWQYWGHSYLWNAMEFISPRFRNAQEMIDEVHASGAKIMASVWPSFGPMTKPYKELDEKGLLFNFDAHPVVVDEGYRSGVRMYKAFSEEAKAIYWKYLRKLAAMGIDAFWQDASEPEITNFKDSDLEQDAAVGSLRKVINAFPLETVGGVYSRYRKEFESRPLILTRCAFTGQQRTGANTWSGDIQTSWDVLRKQIPAGLGFALTGNPNFNTDIGGFYVTAYNDNGRYGTATRNPRFHELYVRWAQYGAFCPMMRSHGTGSMREFYYFGKEGEPVYDALVGAVKLRYSLMPYIYSTAWQVTSNAGTYQRALVTDFAADRNTWDITDEFLFGKSLLVAPVVHAQYTPEEPAYDETPMDLSRTGSREVYLPKGAKWYDFHTGELFAGGRTVTRETPLDLLPLYVRAGSIIPIAPVMQYTTEKPWDSLEIKVYTGADGTFTLYEDEGDNFNYENGAYSTIDFTLRGGTLTIGARKGEFPGMLAERNFHIIFVSDAGTKTRDVHYVGNKLTVK